WLHTIPFITVERARSIIQKLEEGELRRGLESSALPVLSALDRLLATQSGNDFCIPRMGQFGWDLRRLEISVSLSRVIARTPYLELHCYLLPGLFDRTNLEESASRAASLIAAPLRPDLRDWVDGHDILRTTLVDTEAGDSVSVSHRAFDVLNHEL